MDESLGGGARVSRGTHGAAYCEGHDAYYDGASMEDCPYPDTDERVDGTASLTCRMLREDWLAGWDIARRGQA